MESQQAQGTVSAAQPYLAGRQRQEEDQEARAESPVGGQELDVPRNHECGSWVSRYPAAFGA